MEAAYVRNERAQQQILNEEKEKTSILKASGDYVPPQFEPMGTSNLDFDEMSKTDPELRKLMMQLEEDNTKYSEGEENSDEEDAVEDLDLDADAGNDDSGYEDGEKQYAEWVRKHDMEDDDDDDGIDDSEMLSEDIYKEAFTAEDKEFFDGFDLPLDDDDEADAEVDKMAREAMGMTVDDEEGGEGNGKGKRKGKGKKDEVIKEMLNSDQLMDLLKSLGFDNDKDEPDNGRGTNKRQDIFGGGQYRPESEYEEATKAGLRAAANRISEYEKNDKSFDKNRRGDMDGKVFRDPFSTTTKRPPSKDTIEQEEHKNDLMDLLDSSVKEDTTAFERKTRVPSSTHVREADGSFSYIEKKQHSYREGKKEEVKLFSDFTPAEIQDEWDLVEFGR